MAAARISHASRRFALLGLASLICWQAAVLVVPSRRLAVLLGVVGFVLSVAFGKAYALVPTYFDRTLAFDAAPDLHLLLAAAGVAALGAGEALSVPALGTAGGVLWTAGVGVFLVTLGWTIRGNLSGRDTATGESSAHRRRVDRVANAFVPVAGLYLLLGSYALLALHTPAPPTVGHGWVGPAHLLATGFATLLLFAVGARLLPRFTNATPPLWLVSLVLLCGAAGPAALVVGFPAGPVFLLGAVLEASGVVGFAAVCVRLLATTDRHRAGFVGVAAGMASGVAGVALGVGFAAGLFVPVDRLVVAHFRLNVLGFLGLTVVGVLFQFYPPAVGAFPVNDDRVVRWVIPALAVGLWVEVGGVLLEAPAFAVAGRLLGLAGSAAVLLLVVGVFRARARRNRERERST